MNQSAEPGLANVLAAIKAAGEATSRFGAEQLLRSKLPPLMRDSTDDAGEPPAWTEVERAASIAFGYQVAVREENGSRRVRFDPFFASGNNRVPLPVSELQAETIDCWERLADRVETPFAEARLRHLLFAARRGNGRERATAAVHAYLASAEAWQRDIDAARDLEVAVRLARSIGDSSLAAEAMAALLRRSREALDEISEKPGLFMSYIRPLILEDDAPGERMDLLRRASTMTSDPWILAEIYEMLLMRVEDDVERSSLQESAVQVWLDAAARSAGLVRASHLKTALQAAEVVGRTDLRERAAAALQAIAKEDLGLVSFSASTAVSDEQIEDMLAPIVDRDDWRESLILLGSPYLRATGNVETNRRAAAEHAAQFVFASLLPRELLGADGLPRFTPQNEADQQEMALAEQESYQLQFKAPLIARALLGIARKHGIPAEDDLIAFFATNPMVSEDLARALSRVLIRYWAGDFEAAAFTAAPRVETLARGLVMALDAGVYRLQRQQRPGQYPGLATLLSVLKERGIDESWYRMIYTVTCNPAGGWNVRNEIVHGFVDDTYAPVAAVLIQAIVHLITLGPSSAANRDSEDPAEEPPKG